MNVWQRLGIEPTTDLREIKRAYAKQLKLIDQDTQPDEFIQLRQALQEAQYEAEYELEQTNEEDLEQNDENEADSTPIFTASQHSSELDSESNFHLQHDQVESNERWSHQHEQSYGYSYEQRIQNVYFEIENHILARDIHFDISTHLKEFIQLLDQDPQEEISLQYRQRILDLFNSNQLEDFTPYIIDAHHKQQLNHTSTTTQQPNIENDAFDVQYPSEETQPFSTADVDETFQHETPALRSTIEDLNEALWQSDISDPIFEKFKHILNLQTTFGLSEQIWIKDQLQAALASVETEFLHPKYTRFLELWLVHYPDDFDHYPDGYYAHQLQERLQYYVENNHQIDYIPRDEFPLLELLEGEQPLQSNEVVSLKKQLEQRRPDLEVMDTVAIFRLNNTESNPNYFFLKALVIRKKLFWLNSLFVLIFFCFLEYWLKITQDSTTNALISMVGGWTFFYFVQPYVLTFLAARPNVHHLPRNFALIWFLSGFFLCAFSHLIPAPIHMVLSYMWVLISMLLLGLHQLLSSGTMNKRLQFIKIKLDGFMIHTALLILMVGIIALFAFAASPPTPWSVVFALIPIALLLFPDSFRPLLFAFGRMKLIEEMSYEHFILSTLIRVLFRFTLFITITYFLISDASKPYFYLASTCILSLYLALSNTARFAWFLKILGYLFYTIICLVLLLYIPFIGIAGIWLLFYTIKQQNQTHQAA